MRAARRSVLVVAMCCLSIAMLATVGVGAGAPSPTADAPTGSAEALDGTAPAQTPNPVVVTQEFSALPDRPGQVRVTRRFELPENVRTVRTELPPRTTVTETSGGFSHIAPNEYEWAGGSRTPSITHVLPVNETGSKAGPEGADGRFRFVDVGEWGLFRRPGTPTNVEYVNTPITLEKDATVSGPGVAGERLIFVGRHTTRTRRADGQRLRLVVPAAATLAEPAEEILASVADASTSLRVGHRDEEVLMVAAPRTVDWAVRGLQTGSSDLYVVADEPLDQPDNTWLHEYVHTRQDFELAEDARWIAEATATYYAGLETLDQNRVDFQSFRRLLGTGRLARFESVVLADQSTWRTGAVYWKGALVTGELDRQLRVATDSSTDFQAVFRRLNEQRDEIDAAEFLAIVDRLAPDDVTRAADRYTTTTQTPDVWGVATHGEAFGQLPPRIHVRLPEDRQGASYRVGGDYRNRSVADPPVVLVPGERLQFAVEITNAGGTTGTYNLSYGTDEASVGSVTGTLDAQASTEETISVQVDDLGDGAVVVGEHSVPVTVVEPAEATVRNVTANRTDVDPGEAVELTVAVANDATKPGSRTLTVRRGERALAERTVRLDAGESRTLTVPVRLTERGSEPLVVDETSVEVRVGSGIADAIGPGFGPVAAVVGILAAVAVAVAVGRTRWARN